MITYFSWWYGTELKFLWQAIGTMIAKIYSFFSISLLIKTLFDPWKRDVVSAENLSINDRFRLLIGNLVSRFVGFLIRFVTILIGLFFTLAFALLMIVFLVVWLFLPIIIILLIFNGTRIILND